MPNIKSPPENPECLTPTGECLKGLEMHEWGPDDFLYGSDPVWRLPPDDPARRSIEAVLRVQMTCDRYVWYDFGQLRREMKDSAVTAWELDFLAFHYERRVLGWEHFLIESGLHESGWASSKTQAHDQSAGPR